MTASSKQKALNLVALYPALWLALVYLFILRVRVHLGHWPSSADGVAERLGFASFHHALAGYALMAAPWILLGIVISVVVCKSRDRTFRAFVPIAILTGSLLLWTAVGAADPSGFILWWADD